MRIDLSDRAPFPRDTKLVLRQDEAPALFEELRLDGLLEGRFQIFPQGDDRFLVNGSVQGAQFLTCVRTLETFRNAFSTELVFEVEKATGIQVQEMDDDDGDTFVVRIPALQEYVDITEIVRQLVILQEPMNPVKDPGSDFVWKDKDSGPDSDTSDPRWDKLKALRDKFSNPNG